MGSYANASFKNSSICFLCKAYGKGLFETQ